MSLDENDKRVLSDLIRKRGVVKAALTRMKNFVDGFDVTTEAISLLEFRQEELPRLNAKFDEYQTQIEMLVTIDFQIQEEERNEFEQRYFCLRSQIQEMINSKKELNSSINNNVSTSTFAVSRARLAPITIPTFNGNIQEWESFFDCFRAMVHEDNNFTAAHKFYYLRSSVSGAALELIKAIPMTESNYEEAIDRLKRRYDNQSLVIQSHIQSILEAPYVEEPSGEKLQTLHAYVCAHLAALKAAGQPTEYWDAWLITIIVSRLDTASRQDWQLRQQDTKLPKYVDLENFLTSRCIALQGAESMLNNRTEQSKNKKGNIDQKTKNNYSGNFTKKALVAAGGNEYKCVCCSGPHRLFACNDFKKLSAGNRITLVRSSRLCFNCLSPGHRVIDCQSNFTCGKCKQKHNTLLHYESQGKPNLGSKTEEQVQIENQVASGGTSPQLSLSVSKANSHVFLSTAIVHVIDRYGVKQKCRAVLDSGSQVHFISRSFLKVLKLHSEKTTMPVSGIGSAKVQATAAVNIEVKSRVKNYGIRLSCLVLPTVVCESPYCAISNKRFSIPEKLVNHLADPSFVEAGAIDLLIGGGAFYDLLEAERVKLNIGSIHLQDTKFGWIVTGETEVICLLNAASNDKKLIEEKQIMLYNKEESYNRLSKSNRKCIEEQEALQHFNKTAKRDAEGRFVLRLPVKPGIVDLGNTLNMAKSRFFSIERKLRYDTELRREYIKFMEEYLWSGHMEEVINDNRNNDLAVYLPHHAVIKKNSLTTKVRVVFDASSKGSKGHSLNDILLCGPVLQDDVFTILCRFRKHRYVITADVEKMYRQIRIAEEDCDLQRILWRSEETEELRTYRLLRVTYGMTPASFMATQCLVVLAKENKSRFPSAANAIENDFYMDDLMTGGESEEECLRLQQQISCIMDTAKFPLRKWCSNSFNVREQLSKGKEDPLYSLEVKNEDSIKSLGLYWRPEKDTFQYDGVMRTPVSKLSKRVLLSELNRVFDPLGFLVPILIKGKIFIQQVWQLKMDWDCALPDDIQSRWSIYQVELENIRSVSIPRGTHTTVESQIEIHGFCDASQEAYGACVYVRSRDNTGNWHSQLLCAKSRVASLKGETIPRLELNGALALAQLVSKVATAWRIDCRKCHLWSDSTIVLGWLNAQSIRLKTYVSNRVSQILEVTDSSQWRYVNTRDNPADIISRGMSVVDLRESELWWEGPSWLKTEYSTFTPPNCQALEESELPEQCPIKLALITLDTSKDLINIYSSWHRITRAIAWLSRFWCYLRRKRLIQIRGPLSVAEVKLAEVILLKRVQHEAFPKEIAAMLRATEIPRNSPLITLCPFLKDGLIVVGGRLENADIPAEQKHPIVLPFQHKVTRLILQEIHEKLLHCGPQLLLAETRRLFWPLKGRLIARSTVIHCVQCVRAKPKFQAPIMAPLPRQRVQCSRPFTVTGIDFAGPITVRSGIRGRPGKKAWIAMFVCFSTRAVHMETVEDLTSSAFMATLRRFISRRGKPNTIWSDNGTNFVGAQRELATYIDKVDQRVVSEGIIWKFNPPSAPHFGGLWESAIKSAKHHLTRVVRGSTLSFGELQTLLCQIEACLNSRPLTPLSSDPNDLEPITPAHFLIGGPMVFHPAPVVDESDLSYLKRWKLVQCMLQSFWKRWHAEYLPQLQIRNKWTTKTRPIVEGDVVIVKEENTPPTKWSIARVINIHPGKDAIARVATIQMANRTQVRRPIVKLCRLPIEDTESVENVKFQRGEDVSTANGPAA